MTIDIVINLNAGRLGSDTAQRRALLQAASAAGAAARVHQTHSLAELDRVAHDIAAHGTEGVVLAGGDGSHMAGVTAVCSAFGEALPPVALAPCGTVCSVARNFGMRKASGGWTERLVRAVCTGAFRIVNKPTLRVCDDRGDQRVGFIFGAGLVARFFEHYYGSTKRGLGVAARIVSRVFVGSFLGSPLAERILAPTSCAVSLDGAPYPAQAWTLVLASVVRDVGLHLFATYRAAERHDRFHVVASALSPRELGPQLPRVFTGRPLTGEPRIDTLARSLRVEFHETSDGVYVLDGDVFRAHEACVTAGPLLPLIVPLP